MKEIEKLKNKEVLSYQELSNIFNKYLHDEIDDIKMTEVLELICKNGLTDNEIFDLCDIFINSGECYLKNTSFIDKHSTGGVGDKTTLIVLPILASLNIKISKMSGRALGYTGGTIDKLESIGVKTDLSKKEFYDIIGKHNMVIASQTDNLVPMDKKVYALRDVTGTTKSIPLIATSIMSKKIASGAGKILIDIKVGKGALIETKKDALKLASLMIKIGKKYDREVVCMLTRMDDPLGNNIGNKLEILEVLDILNNKKHNNLYDLSINMASIMYSMIRKESFEKSLEKVLSVIENGKAYEKFLSYISDLGGSVPIEKEKFIEIKSLKNGYIKSINSMIVGSLSMSLGAGRIKKDDKIDYDAGIVLLKNVRDKVKKDDVIARLYGKNIDYSDIHKAFKYSFFKSKNKSIIIKVLK